MNLLCSFRVLYCVRYRYLNDIKSMTGWMCFARGGSVGVSGMSCHCEMDFQLAEPARAAVGVWMSFL